MKYQYLVFEEASIIRFEIKVEYMWELVANPTEVSRNECFTVLSIDAAMAITFVLHPDFSKKFVRKVASLTV